MIIKLDLTKRQLSYIIAAMSYRLRSGDMIEVIRDPEKSWDFKADIAYEFAQCCVLLTMLEKTFNSATEEQDDAEDA